MSSLDDIFKKIYEPKTEIADENLPRAVRERKRQARAEAEESVKLKETPASADTTSKSSNTKARPLTLEEAEVVEERIDKIRGRIERIKGKIGDAELQIIEQLEGNPDLPSFKMNIVGKPRLRKAAKVCFGYKAEEITFAMYRQALEEKAAMEKEDASSMFEEEEDSSSNVMDVLKGVV